MIYCIHGTESLLVKRKIDELIKQYVNEQSEVNCSFYDAIATTFSISELIDECSMMPFFSEHKMVVVRNATFLSGSGTINENDQKILKQYMENANPSTILVLSGYFEKLDSRKKIVKFITGCARTFTFNQMKQDEFQSFVRASVKQAKLELLPGAIEELQSRLRPNRMDFENTLQKLELYPDEISASVIRRLVDKPLEDNVFTLVNAVVVQDLKVAMHTWRDLQVANTDPIGLVALIGSQIRLLNQVKILKERGFGESEISGMLKEHPYRLKLAGESVRRISQQRLSRLIQKCAQLDQELKLGLVDKVIGFERFLIAATKG